MIIETEYVEVTGTNISSSTRAYRMKLKEWGLMRHKPRRAHREAKQLGGHRPERSDHGDGDSSDTAGSMSVEPQTEDNCAKTGIWQGIADLSDDAASTVAESTYMGLLGQPQK